MTIGFVDDWGTCPCCGQEEPKIKYHNAGGDFDPSKLLPPLSWMTKGEIAEFERGVNDDIELLRRHHPEYNWKQAAIVENTKKQFNQMPPSG